MRATPPRLGPEQYAAAAARGDKFGTRTEALLAGKVTFGGSRCNPTALVQPRQLPLQPNTATQLARIRATMLDIDPDRLAAVREASSGKRCSDSLVPASLAQEFSLME